MTVPRLQPSAARGLLLGELEEVTACDHEPVLLAELVDGREQLLPLLRVDGGRLGGGGRLPRGRRRNRPQREVGAAARGPAAVAGFVGDDLEDPRPKRRAGPEAVQRRPGLHEPLLGGILRIRGAPGDEVRRAKRDPLICLHEVSIGGFIALLGPFDELRFLQWTALHCLLLHLLAAAVPHSL